MTKFEFRLGEIAFDAFDSNRSVAGLPSMRWDELPTGLRQAWAEAAGAVLAEITGATCPYCGYSEPGE